jgi:hypothetical protein
MSHSSGAERGEGKPMWIRDGVPRCPLPASLHHQVRPQAENTNEDEIETNNDVQKVSEDEDKNTGNECDERL